MLPSVLHTDPGCPLKVGKDVTVGPNLSGGAFGGGVGVGIRQAGDDAIGKRYDPSVFEKVINDIAKAAKVTILNISKYKFEPQGFTILEKTQLMQ